MPVYATIGDLTVWLGKLGPPDSPRLLERASQVIDDATRTAVYQTTVDDRPQHPRAAQAFTDATCAQVEFWLAGDEQDDVLGPTQGVSVGGLQEQYGAGENRITPMHLAPRAWRALRTCPEVRW